MKKHRRKHAAEFKARVALEAIQGIEDGQLDRQGGRDSPGHGRNWKKEMLARLPELFESKDARKEQASAKEKEDLHRKVGQLAMEVDFQEKKCKQLGMPGSGWK